MYYIIFIILKRFIIILCYLDHVTSNFAKTSEALVNYNNSMSFSEDHDNMELEMPNSKNSVEINDIDGKEFFIFLRLLNISINIYLLRTEKSRRSYCGE